jgi:PAS domain S-box-containing protein
MVQSPASKIKLNLAQLLLDPSEAKRTKASETLRQTLAELEDVKTSLRVSSERLERALQSAGEFAWEVDHDTRNINVIGDARSALGFDLAATEQERIRHLHPEDRPRVTAANEAMLAGKALHDVENRLINPATGETVWVSWAERLVAEGGRVKLVGITRNITTAKNAELKRNEMETALRESRERFRRLASIVEFSDDAIISKNLDGGNQLGAHAGYRR